MLMKLVINAAIIRSTRAQAAEREVCLPRFDTDSSSQHLALEGQERGNEINEDTLYSKRHLLFKIINNINTICKSISSRYILCYNINRSGQCAVFAPLCRARYLGDGHYDLSIHPIQHRP